MKQQKEATIDERMIISSGVGQPFWVLLRSIIQENIDHMGSLINGDIVDEELGKLTPTMREELVKWRLMNKNLLDLPEQLVRSMDEGKTEPIAMDPYYTVEELLKHEIPN